MTAQIGALTPRQRRAIGCLLVARNTTEAAKAAGLGRRTLVTWLRDPVFVAALRAAEAEALDGMSRRLMTLADLALDNLDTVLEDGEATDANRLRAADLALVHMLKIREHGTIAERIADLEEQMDRLFERAGW